MADGKVTIKIDGDSAGLQKALNDVKPRIEALDKPLQQTGEIAEDAMGAATDGVEALAGVLAAAGITASLKQIGAQLYACYKSASQFNAGMAQTFTLLPNITEQIKADTVDAVIDLKNEFGIMGDVSTSAIYSTVSATGDLNASLSDLEVGQKAAIGGATNLATAMDGLTTVTNSYGKDVVSTQQASDLMFTAVRLGKTTFKELSASLYNVLPITSANKIAFEDVTAALAHMTTQGVPTAQATTQLRQLFVELTDSGTNVSKTFEKIAGKSFKEFIAQGGNTQEALSLLERYATDAGFGVSELFGSVEAGGAAMALSGKNATGYTDKLTEMKNAAGATSDAFDVMAETSAYTENRFKSAAETIQISIGNVLEPALKDLYETGADAFIWASEFIDANPWVVQGIAALTAGLAVAALGIAGITAATALATPAMAAFTAALAANPVGMFAVGVTAAVSSLGVFVATLGEANPELKEAQEFAQGTADAFEAVTKSTEDGAAAATVQAETANKLLDKLQALETQGLKTATSQEEYSAIVAQLAQLYPELNVAVDEQTGLLKAHAGALKTEVSALKEQAVAALYYDAQTKAINALAEAEYQLETNGKRYLELTKERSAAQERMLEIEQTLTDTTGLSTEQIAALNGEYTQCQDLLRSTSAEYMEQEAIASTYQEAVDSASLAVEQATTALEENNQKAQENAQATAAMTEQFDIVQEKQSDVEAHLASLTEAFNANKQAALDNINSVVNGFTYFDTVAATSASSVSASLQSQLDYMDTYSTNFQSFMSRAGDSVPEEFVAQLSDGSVESAEILAGLATASDEEVAAVVESMKSVADGKEAFSTEIAKTRTDFDTEMDKIQSKIDDTTECFNQTSKATANVNATVDAVVSTINARMAEVQAAYAALTEAGSSSGGSGGGTMPQQNVSAYNSSSAASRTFSSTPTLLNSAMSSNPALRSIVSPSATSTANSYSIALNFHGDVNDPDVIAQKVNDLFTYDLAGAR